MARRKRMGRLKVGSLYFLKTKTEPPAVAEITGFGKVGKQVVVNAKVMARTKDFSWELKAR